ncbi:hypothetical protein PVAR5_0700 [Paecilomyces variotii No. 5]|uniref:Uncharacterized protein n=1 Tax=Byssochlamys spectabilis (strain No. 5 / NBRC 109023) TaxID=1356009 RepID=V5F894_BYSSN|nr:hypothetical protein PVAR5_0700 [Paecilomyces variotii No. 5]
MARPPDNATAQPLAQLTKAPAEANLEMGSVAPIESIYVFQTYLFASRLLQAELKAQKIRQQCLSTAELTELPHSGNIFTRLLPVGHLDNPLLVPGGRVGFAYHPDQTPDEPFHWAPASEEDSSCLLLEQEKSGSK